MRTHRSLSEFADIWCDPEQKFARVLYSGVDQVEDDIAVPTFILQNSYQILHHRGKIELVLDYTFLNRKKGQLTIAQIAEYK